MAHVFPLGNVREQLVECLVVLDEALNTGESACYSVCCVLWQRLGVMRHHTNDFVPVGFFPFLMMIEMMPGKSRHMKTGQQVRNIDLHFEDLCRWFSQRLCNPDQMSATCNRTNMKSLNNWWIFQKRIPFNNNFILEK